MDERFTSPGAAFAAQQAEETRLLIEVEKAMSRLAERAREGVLAYTLSAAALRQEWEREVQHVLERCGFTGPPAEALRRSLVGQSIAEDMFQVADGVMRYALAEGSTRAEIEEALAELLGDPSLVASGAVRRLWQKVQDWLPSRTRAWRSRARSAVRTAYTGYSGALAQAWLETSGATFKRWVTRRDDRVRHTHHLADGQAVPVQGRFLVGEGFLAFPGDPTGPIGEVINCRCVLVAADRQGK
jgi:hypothetical protein